ncbi:MAG: hypothetical protein CFE50_10000 [Pseudomonas sp. PGPPP4]|uniref:hypothetical protein n=1 Tax=Pseudomonas sp. PGPPP4 TaxID=2015556 RepID=UPI000BD855FE|nr:hypothetical protein [Pseudomonas sp. PGPPP4]OYT84098.1 MAG: hypothetical protein CFE50_10000 [Pseudomonas sp. PGPPP4]
MRPCLPLLLALLLTLSGCAVQQPAQPAGAAIDLDRSPSWTLQARLHSALYGCELLVLHGNNARLAGEQGRLADFRQQLSSCQTQATAEEKQAMGQLPTGQDRLLRNAQKAYLAAWQRYLAELTIDHPADLQQKQSYLKARSALLEVASKRPDIRTEPGKRSDSQLTTGS